jgi:hypothetical protein
MWNTAFNGHPIIVLVEAGITCLPECLSSFQSDPVLDRRSFLDIKDVQHRVEQLLKALVSRSIAQGP